MGCITSDATPTQKELFQRDMAILVTNDIAPFLEVPLKMAFRREITSDPYIMFFYVMGHILYMAHVYPDYPAMAERVAIVNQPWLTEYLLLEVPKWTPAIKDIAIETAATIGNFTRLMSKMLEYRSRKSQEYCFISLYSRCQCCYAARSHQRERQAKLKEKEGIANRTALLLNVIQPLPSITNSLILSDQPLPSIMNSLILPDQPLPSITNDVPILTTDYPPPYTI